MYTDISKRKKQKLGLSDAQRKDNKFHYMNKINKLNEDNKNQKKIDAKIVQQHLVEQKAMKMMPWYRKLAYKFMQILTNGELQAKIIQY